jgi:TP901 family phage tail tape measure protein
MADVKNKRIVIFIDQAAAEAALEKLQVKADGFNKKIDESRKKQEALLEKIREGESAGKNVDRLKDQYTKLSATISTTNKSLKENGDAQNKIKEQIDKGLRPSLAQQEKLVTSLRNQLKHLSEDAPLYAQKFTAFQKATAELDRMKTALTGVEKAQRNWFQEAKVVAFGVLIGNTIQSAIQAIGSYLSGIVTGNAKLADSLKDVEKATGLTSAEVAHLNSDLSKIDTRTATSDLREIAIGLGQINEEVSKNSVAAIDKIVVALGDEFGGGAREITTQLSVLRNNLQDIKTGNYGEDVLHIGNALNVLGAEGLATAPVVTDVANRVAGVARTFKISSGDILGTAATFQELGIEVERGSTAYVKILQKIAQEPAKFAKVSGLGIKEFTDLVNNDMQAAFVKVAEGAKKFGTTNVAFASILKELDADGSGAGEVLSKLGSNAELLTTKMNLATNALKGSDSITEEFTKKNSGLGAELDKLKKSFDSFIQSKTLSDFLSAGVRGLNAFIAALRVTPQWLKENQTAIYLIIAGIALFNAAYIKAGVLIARDTALKLINAATTRATAIANNIAVASQSAYITVTTLLAGRITIATAAQKLWNIAVSLGAGPIGVLVVAVGALTLGLGNLFGVTKKISTEQSVQFDVNAKLAETYEDQKSKITQLTAIAQDLTLDYQIRKKALDELIATSPEYLKGLTLENITSQKGVDILNDYIDTLGRVATAQALVDLKKDLNKNRTNQDVDIKVKKQAADNEGFFSDFFGSAFGTSASSKYTKALQENVETTQKFNVVNEQIDETVKKLNFDISVQQGQLSKLTKGTDEYNKTVRALNSLIKERNIYLQLPQDTGIITDTPPPKTTNTASTFGSTEENTKRSDLLKRLKDFQFELDQVGKTHDESEIERITKKYDELIKEAARYGVTVIDLEKSKNRAIAFLIDEETRKRKEAGEKQFKETAAKEYDNTIAETARYYESLKELEAQSFVDGKIDRKQYEANIAAIDVAGKQAQIRNAQDYSKVVEKAAADVTKFKKEELQKEVADLIAANEKKLRNERLTKQLMNDAAIARAQNKVNTSRPGSNARLAAEKALLEEQKRQELQAIDERETEAIQAGIKYTTEFNDLRANINAQYREKETQAEVDFYAGQINEVLNYVSSALDIIGQFNSAKNARENDDLNKELKQNDAKKAALKRQLDAKLISQVEYQKRVAALDADAEKKKEALEKKQFQRNKRLQIAQAIVNGAMAITSTLAARPGAVDILSLGAFRAINIAIAIATTAAQIATIASTKYALGGKTKGPSHAENGLPVINPRTGQKVAELEGDEGILKKSAMQSKQAYTVTGTPSEIASTLNTKYGGVSWDRTVPLKPAYKTRPYQSINYNTITKTFTKLKYAEGGVFSGSNNTGGSNGSEQAVQTDPALLTLLDSQQKLLAGTQAIFASNQSTIAALATTVNTLNNRLRKPIQAEVPLNKITAAQDLQASILEDATFK